MLRDALKELGVVMRWWLAVSVLLGFVLAPGPVAAQAQPPCQTANGQKWIDAMVTELVSAGYGGPYDPASVISAYARTTGGAVTCAGYGGGAPTIPTTELVGIGGLDSDAATIAARFGVLAQQLGANMQVFGYTQSGLGAYLPSATCAPEAASRATLLRLLRNMRQQGVSHVVLAGHSLGGVLAFDAAAEAADLTAPPDPFIRGVITIDSPLGGITALARFVEVLQDGNCAVLQDLRDRSYRANVWQPWLTNSANYLQNRGVNLAVIANPEDMAVLFADQQINAPVNYTLDYVDSELNHSAILNSSDAMSAIAGWVGTWFS